MIGPIETGYLALSPRAEAYWLEKDMEKRGLVPNLPVTPWFNRWSPC